MSLSTGCATHAARSSAVRFTNPVSASTMITRPELAGVAEGQNLLVAIQRSRPWFLVSRGSAPLVSIDGAPPMELAVLRSIPVSTVHEVRLVRGSSSVGHTAVLPNGDVVLGDLIVVSTRAR